MLGSAVFLSGVHDQCVEPSCEADGTEDAAEIDALLDALAHHRRRETVRALQAVETPTTLSELADEVARRERVAGNQPDPGRVQTMLHHWHLPRLAEAGLVRYTHEVNPKQVDFTGPPGTTEALVERLALPSG